MKLTQELREEYQRLWDSCEIRETDYMHRAVARLKYHQSDYTCIAAVFGMPWQVVAVVHDLEASGDFGTHLHNGDSLQRRTVNVPKGRPRNGTPPFAWGESAIDALSMKITNGLRWDIPSALHWLEGYNGWGYRLYHNTVLSPYLWSMTNHYAMGKYIADGKWDSTAVSKQIGAVPLLKLLGFEGRESMGIVEDVTGKVDEVKDSVIEVGSGFLSQARELCVLWLQELAGDLYVHVIDAIEHSVEKVELSGAEWTSSLAKEDEAFAVAWPIVEGILKERLGGLGGWLTRLILNDKLKEAVRRLIKEVVAIRNQIFGQKWAQKIAAKVDELAIQVEVKYDFDLTRDGVVGPPSL